MFVKRAPKEALDLNFVEVIIVKKYLHYIGVVDDHEDYKDSKDTINKSQASSAKNK